jgi:protein pelota
MQAVYGEREVFLAHNHRALEHLLITDGLFRSKDFRARKKYIQLVDECKRNGVVVHIFSDLHPSGEKLKEITGEPLLKKESPGY